MLWLTGQDQPKIIFEVLEFQILHIMFQHIQPSDSGEEGALRFFTI